ncbi:2-isopropylmalate synthase [candidate division KSB1 bacterium]|nr:2-isopropylmalate synthase [candidate division KSB1 bacterium]
MKAEKVRKYQPFPQVDLPDRQWPKRQLQKAPTWCSVDLRDGNQALQIPMDLERKIKLFKLLVDVGFKEIEVGFPSAAAVEYAFVRELIEENLIPHDVTIQVLTQAREHLIRKTFEAIEGAKNVIVHLYNSTSALQRNVVFKANKSEVIGIAVQGAKLLQELKNKANNSGIRFQYSPESFTSTELEYALEVCHAVLDVWQPSPTNKVIINLPATVEMCTPNIHADQIEWMCNHLKNRENIIVSLHTHNDRGTAVAATELALLAGADRVEGTLFGNGERTGNVDIVTTALNLFTQGVNPKLDFSNINAVKKVYEECTRMEVHDRHPYAGALVYTAFSGSHQDAISKGMAAHEKSDSHEWAVPYLPIDPRDVGRTYEKIIRINSQSGKGGVAYILEQEFGLKLPKAMQPEFGKIIQKVTDNKGDELPPKSILEVFKKEYLELNTPYFLKHCSIHTDADSDTNNGAGNDKTSVNAVVHMHGVQTYIAGRGNGPIDAFANGLKEQLDFDFQIETYDEHAVEHGSASRAVTYISLKDDNDDIFFGAGLDSNISLASFKALLSALNRMEKQN